VAIKYIHRTIEPIVERASREFSAVVLTGPRQSGKTTLLKHLFSGSHKYVSLEPPDIRAIAETNPRGFLDNYKPPVIFDEIQYAPSLLPYIKEQIDSNRESKGQYILTGSQNILMTAHVTETLAGRAAMLKLLPLSFREIFGCGGAALPWENGDGASCPHGSGRQMWNSFLRGGYPELAADPKRDAFLWQGSYIQTYLERDIRFLRQIGDLTTFQSFLRALAARNGQLLKLTEMARDLGVAVNTVKSWLSVLEATFQIIILRPYFGNITKRLVKTPKVYFTDVGTLCYLAGLKDPDHAANGPMGGAIFETAVVGEIFKTLVHRGEEPQLYFWRTSTGIEVDIVAVNQGRLVPIEVRLAATCRPAMAESIKIFQQDFGDKSTAGYVVHPGSSRLPLTENVTALPFAEL
jgi:predicted AAA+ superfamily ATPase